MTKAGDKAMGSLSCSDCSCGVRTYLEDGKN